MFVDALSKIGTSTISLPIGVLSDATNNVVATFGVGLPGAVVPHLTKVGFSHSVAEDVAKTIFESSGKTLTGHWMDATGPFKSLYPEGVSVGWHRIHGHHFLTDAVRSLDNANLSVVDFYRHLATDVVTKNGLPLLPEEFVRNIAATLGTTPSKVMPWVSMNILDIGASALAVGHAGSNVVEIVYGTAEWGTGYAIDTLGVGTLEVAAGIATKNPILIGSGTVDIACGTVTAYEYYTQPFFCGVPVEEILMGSAIGSCLATILLGVEMVASRKPHVSKKKKALIAGERLGTAAVLSGLSVIAVPLSITTSLGIVGCKLSKELAEDSNSYIRAMPVTGNFSKEIDQFIAQQFEGTDRLERVMSYLD